MESLPEQWEQGFTTICVKPSMFIDDPRDLPKFCREAVQRAESLVGASASRPPATRRAPGCGSLRPRSARLDPPVVTGPGA